MSSTHVAFTDTDDRTRARQALVPVAVAVAGAGSVLAWLSADTRGEAIGEVVFIPLLTAAVFGLVVTPGLRHSAAGGRGIAMGVIGLLTVPIAFRSGSHSGSARPRRCSAMPASAPTAARGRRSRLSFSACSR